jgi:hypothetical protein
VHAPVAAQADTIEPFRGHSRAAMWGAALSRANLNDPHWHVIRTRRKFSLCAQARVRRVRVAAAAALALEPCGSAKLDKSHTE